MLGYFEELIVNRSHDGLTSSIKIQAALLEMIAMYIDQGLRGTNVNTKFSSVNKLVDTIKYIDENLDKEMTIHELSQTVHFHPNYFIRFFKTHFGVPPMRYIYDRRMEKAKELLVYSSYSVTEVANMTGFQDGSYFSTSFKKHMGMSPSDFRQVNNGR
ncbi:helix-turn-helix domain-containing protein [Paenibacillus sp. 2RAB27]|uniref:helix-turn-helix domain-containing protein n=1 Tax=Paenibacillus sp. 2RAB27 TaxID=3232991 RepID=UPI003F9AC031